MTIANMQRGNGSVLLACGLAIFAVHAANARDIYVDNLKGVDAVADGTREKPYQSIWEAVKELKTSDSLHLTPTGVPYPVEWEKRIVITVGGTPEKPLIIDGHGATMTGFHKYGPDAWKDEGGGVFSMLFPNNALMKAHWEGFDLVFFDGKPGRSCVSRAKLDPFGYVLFTRRTIEKEKADVPLQTLYIRLPEGKSPADIRIDSAGGPNGGNMTIQASHVIVRNIASTWCRCDGFGSTFSSDLTFENVEAAHNMDQGLSNHSSNGVTVKNSWFHHNSGCGIGDVGLNTKRPARSVYIHCLVENDTFRGGMEFHDGDYRMVNCMIRDNRHSALLVVKNAQYDGKTHASFVNCVFVGSEDKQENLLAIRPDCSATFTNCTFYRMDGGLRFAKVLSADRPSEIFQCAFISCKQLLQIKEFGGGDKLLSNFNYFDPGIIVLDGVSYDAPSAYVIKSGLDKDSLIFRYKGALPPYSLPELQGKGRAGGDIGARLEANPMVGVKRD